ncbi:MAG: tetratricopeptide repeat protein [Bdellovibrionaceae bacterium]|nr:tetratricopeptide repeat protein [Pseudobdellovibrionaceae bacterium]MBX3033272.1 tetratricopeptide repeat protein [Pseudobdellovibrionaceae bacterium]
MIKILLAVSLLSVSAQAQNAPAKKGRDPVAVKKLEENLRKVEASIEVTRQRIKSQKETQFAPDLYFMLAELLHDKAAVSASLKKEKNPNTPDGEMDLTAEKRLTAEAIENYKLIEDRYPQYAALDRVLYTIAQEYKALNDDQNALVYLKKIPEKFPDSTYSVKSLIEIGDIFFARKDYEFALGQFRKALPKAVEPDRSSANYKIGWSLIHSDKWLESLKSFEQVYMRPANAVPLSGKDDLSEEALVASVWPLLELSPQDTLKRPAYQKPIEYYRSVAGDKARFRRVLTRLSQRLTLKKREREAAEASLELFRLSDDLGEKKAAFESAYMQFKKLKSDYFPVWMASELRELLLMMKRNTTDPNMPKDVVKYEAVFRDLVTVMNKNAVSTRRQDDLRDVAQAYDEYLAIYPRSPKSPLMKLNRAEALFQAGEFARAGQSYYDIVRTAKIKSPKRRKELLESSLDSFYKALPETAALVDRFQSRDGYREVAAQFGKGFPQDAKLPAIQFNVAKTYYDEQRFDEAANSLWNFLKKNPAHEESKTAVLLYLDCFYLRDQTKEMAAAGKRVAALPGLSAAALDTAKKASSQAEMKALRSVAGDFGSKNYATKFREFAKKNKNSAMGEQALYEAFTSMKAEARREAYDIGEEYIASYEKNPRAKEVLLALSQLSLIMLDYQRAASYMGTYAQKYPQDTNARTMALQAAQIYENLGSTREAMTAYQMAGDSNAALKMLFKFGDWAELNKAAASVSGLSGQYYQGMSLFRSGNQQAGLSLLRRVAESSGSSPDEKEMTAHAAVMVAEAELAAFKSQGRGQTFSAALLQSKASQYQGISAHLQAAVGSGGGRWVIGALYNLGRLNRDFADFLKAAAPPAGMAPAQLQQLVQGQVKGYEQVAQENFATCLKLAEENEIPTGYVQGCRARNDIAETSEFTPWPKSSRAPANVPADLAAGLRKDPRSPELLRRLAASEIRSGQSSRALLVLSRAAEIAPNDSLNESYLGVAYLNLKQYGYAQNAFQQALSKNPSDPLANRGMAGISRAFGFAAKAKTYMAKGGSSGTPGADLHPWLK